MKKNEQKPIPLSFLIFIVCMISIMAIYISMPKFNKENEEDEVLIVNNINSTKTDLNYNNKHEKSEQNIDNQNYSVNQTQEKTKEDYNKLLDSLKDLPSKKLDSVKYAVNKFLEYKGYPSGLIEIETDVHKSNINIEGSYLIAQFDIASGKMRISKEQLNSLDMKLIISVLAHELDHFEKISQICKSMGEYEFEKLINSYGIKNYNQVFWARASYYANLKNFDSKLYREALYRYLNQNMVEATSSYSDFYKLTENIRNPLEISAYNVSDYIQQYYGIPLTEGPMKSISRKFNDVDWAIYNLISTNDILKDERIPLFDYFFAKAIIYKYPKYRGYYDVCVDDRDGDLTLFWLNFEKSMSDFYINGNLSNETVKDIINLLNDTKREAVRGINNEQIADALKFKVKTLLSNIVYRNAIPNIKKTAATYLKFIKYAGIKNPKTELDFILTLICIENKISNESDGIVKISQLKIPEELVEIYNVKSGVNHLDFIYNNSEFQNIQNKYVLQNEELLLQLLKSHEIKFRKKD